MLWWWPVFSQVVLVAHNGMVTRLSGLLVPDGQKSLKGQRQLGDARLSGHAKDSGIPISNLVDCSLSQRFCDGGALTLLALQSRPWLFALVMWGNFPNRTVLIILYSRTQLFSKILFLSFKTCQDYKTSGWASLFLFSNMLLNLAKQQKFRSAWTIFYDV